MMTRLNLHILLSIVERNGDVGSLLENGLSYEQISDLTANAIKNGLIIYENKSVQLSNEGRQYLQKYRNQAKQQNKEEWIKRETSSIIQKIDSNFIYLPSQNELNF